MSVTRCLQMASNLGLFTRERCFQVSIAFSGMFFLLLLGSVAFLGLPNSIPHSHYEEHSGITMASAPSSITQAMQSARAWHLMRPSRPRLSLRAGHLMQPIWSKQNVQSESALTSLDEPNSFRYPATNAEQHSEPAALVPKGRRGMIAAALASAAAIAAQDGAALAEDTGSTTDANIEKKKKRTKENDDRVGLILGRFGTAAGAFLLLGVPAILADGQGVPAEKQSKPKNKRRR